MFTRVFVMLALLFSTAAQAVEMQDADIENVGLRGTKVLALTFDDGPGPGTAHILETLKTYNVKATFFAVGKMVELNPALTDRIVAEGHVLGNHTYDHPEESRLTNEQMYREIKLADALLKPHLKPGSVRVFRAPYGHWSEGIASLVNADPDLQDYVGPFFWNIGDDIVRRRDGALTDAGDWACWQKPPRGLSVDDCLQGYLARIETEKGGIVLMHDIHLKTAELLDRLLPILMARGYTFTTLTELPALSSFNTQRSVTRDSYGRPRNF